MIQHAMLLNKLKKLTVDALEDLKGREIVALDVKETSDFTDIMIFCSGTSSRHVKSLANSVIVSAKAHNVMPLGIEGNDEGEWVLVDLGDIVVHIMQPNIREFYQLEQLWTVKPE